MATEVAPYGCRGPPTGWNRSGTMCFGRQRRLRGMQYGMDRASRGWAFFARLVHATEVFEESVPGLLVKHVDVSVLPLLKTPPCRLGPYLPSRPSATWSMMPDCFLFGWIGSNHTVSYASSSVFFLKFSMVLGLILNKELKLVLSFWLWPALYCWYRLLYYCLEWQIFTEMG